MDGREVRGPSLDRGVVFQSHALMPWMSVLGNVAFAVKSKWPDWSKEKVAEHCTQYLEMVGLGHAIHKKPAELSGGMKQRVGIAQALLNDPQLLIVDEPTVGLDPEERVRFRNLLSDLSGERIVILSTHIVSDVEATATHIALVNKGQLLREDAPENLLRELENKVWEWTVHSDDLSALKQKHIVSGTIRRSDGVQVRVVSAEKPEAQAENTSPNLEDAYLYFIGGKQ
jgi:ABC-type multidrug transport system ATPase subunit